MHFCFYVSKAFSFMLCFHLQAVGLDSCESFQEETVSDQDGQYRLRGLQVCLKKKNWNMFSSLRFITNSRLEFTCLWFCFTRHLDNQSRKTCCVFNQSEARHLNLRTFSRALTARGIFLARSATGKFLTWNSSLIGCVIAIFGDRPDML